MKKLYLSLLLVIFSFIQLFAEPNYKGGNGTIIFFGNLDGIEKTIRKCEIKNISIGDLLDEKNRDIFDDYNSNNKIGKLKDNDTINVLEVCTIEYTNKPKDKWNNPCGELWYKISFGDMTGCICKYSDYLSKTADPYYENRYEILEEITSTKKWTVRKMDQLVSIWENLNIRNNPGTTNSKVIFTILPGTSDPVQTNVNVIAITEEVETIDGRTDHWLKIKYKNYEGWIFGGYASVERGGPKYYIPESTVKFDLSWY